MPDRGQSEPLGYVFVFSVILLTVGTAYVGGHAALEDARAHEQVNNAERAFEILAENLDDVSQDGVPSRATEVKLADARLSVGDPVTVNVTGEQVVGGGALTPREYTVYPIVYAADDARLVYTSGSVIRSGDAGAVVVREPSFVTTDERVVVSIVQTRSESDQSIGGATTALVRVDSPGASVLAVNETGTWAVTLNVTSGSEVRAAAWARTLGARSDVTCSDVLEPSPGSYRASCQVETQRVYLSLVQMNVAIES